MKQLINRYNNYHKHSHRSNIYTPDTHIKNEDYCKRAIELGHNTIFSTEHGYGGDIFEIVELADKYKLKPIYAVEGYIVKDPYLKDNSNFHIVIIPRSDKYRKILNKILSRANVEGYYYKPRIFLEDLLKQPKDSFYITTACSGGLLKNEDGIEVFMELYKHYGDNVFIEIQTHNSEDQKNLNKKALELSNSLGLKLIHANDSHYIYPSEGKDRQILLNGKNINYGDEDSYILDYPSYDDIIQRYKKQGIISERIAIESIKNTLAFDNIVNIEISKNIKMPNIYKKLTVDERISKLKSIINQNFVKIKKEDIITQEEIPAYLKAIREEMNVIEETKEIHSMDYFLLNEKLIDKAVNEYGGVLTTTSRGSAGAFYTNRLLGITQLDRVRAKIPLYYERFMSAARLLGDNPPYTSSLPDCDFNVSDPEPFIKASKDLLGEHGCKWMIAYGTMQEGEAFRNTCRSKNMSFDAFNEVAKDIDSYRDDKYWKPIIEESKKFVDVIVSASVHPCSNILFDGDLEEELGVLKIGEFYCCPITSGESDDWKYLKNDYLTATTVTLTKAVFDKIGIPRMSLVQLERALDDKVWDIYEKGLTCTINQLDSDWASGMMMSYKARSISEVAIYTGIIRPNFNDYREAFLSRKPFSNGIKHMDEMFNSTSGFIVFQENLMQWFEWLGVPPSKSINLIKKISKKKIKQKDFDELETALKNSWNNYGYTDEEFSEVWNKIQAMLNYGYNSPHALAVGYDSIYGAYQKSHYPLQYYAVALGMYEGDEERTNKLTKELDYFNIKISPIKFGYSKDCYMEDVKTNTIYKSLSSVKFLNKKVAEELYNLSQENKYNNFFDLLKDIKNNTSCNSRQLDILIKLNFFDMFGKSQKLLDIVNVYETIYTKKQFKKDKLPDMVSLDMIRKYSNGETEKQFKNVDTDKLVLEIIKSIKDIDIPLAVLLETQKNNLGYIDYKNPKLDKRYVLVSDINTKYAPVVNTYSLNSGVSIKCKISKKLWNNDGQLKENDIIYIHSMEKKFGSKKVGEEIDKKGKVKAIFEVDNTKIEWWLNSYSVINDINEVLNDE